MVKATRFLDLPFFHSLNSGLWMIGITISESHFCIFVYVVLTCLLVYYSVFFFFFDGSYGPRGIQINCLSFIILTSCIFILQALFLSIKLLFQIISTRFLHHFLYIIFNYLYIFSQERRGSINKTLEELFFRTILSFSILSRSFTVAFLQRCLFAF